MRKFFESYNKIMIASSNSNATFFITKNNYTIFLLSILLKLNFITIQKLLKINDKYYYFCRKNFSNNKNNLFFKNYSTSRRLYFFKTKLFNRLNRQFSKNIYYIIYTNKGLIFNNNYNYYLTSKNISLISKNKQNLFYKLSTTLPKTGILIGKFKIY
jgi:hypothetical protein